MSLNYAADATSDVEVSMELSTLASSAQVAFDPYGSTVEETSFGGSSARSSAHFFPTAADDNDEGPVMKLSTRGGSTTAETSFAGSASASAADEDDDLDL